MKDFLSISDLTPEAYDDILTLAARMKRQRSANIPHPYLAGKNLGMIVEKASTPFMVCLSLDEAQKIFSDFHRENLIELGIDGFKLDECDNSDFVHDWSFPNCTEFPSGMDGEQYHQMFLSIEESDDVTKQIEAHKKAIEEAEEKTKSGLILTASAQEKPQIAEVVAVGPGAVVDGKLVPMEVKIGDKVLMSKYAGTEVKLDGVEYIILSQKDILAKVD